MEQQEQYIKILRESLEKKERILHNLLHMTKEQQDYINGSDFEFDVFNDMMDVKAQMIDELDSVDQGFETVYERIGEYLQSHKAECKDAILEMQNRIREITSLGIQLQAMEERNRAKLEQLFSKRRAEISGFQKNTKQVNTYYQNMMGLGGYTPSILDRKK